MIDEESRKRGDRKRDIAPGRNGRNGDPLFLSLRQRRDSGGFRSGLWGISSVVRSARYRLGRCAALPSSCWRGNCRSSLVLLGLLLEHRLPPHVELCYKRDRVLEERRWPAVAITRPIKPDRLKLPCRSDTQESTALSCVSSQPGSWLARSG